MRRLLHKGPLLWWWQGLVALLAVNSVVAKLAKSSAAGGSNLQTTLALIFSGFDMLVTLAFLLFSVVYFRYRKHGGQIDSESQ